MANRQYNLRNPAVKRILQEIKEVQADTSGDLIAEALESDIFEWHFVIRGPPDTEFEGGIYHGRILLPADYPFKPPGFMMLSPNGRFETMMKICLSISSHHPEHWQPSWSVRTALTALIAFMPTPGEGALGSLDLPKEERRKMAAKSREAPPRFGSAERQKLIEEMHARMLAMPLSKRPQPGPSGAAGSEAVPASGVPAASAPAAPAVGAPDSSAQAEEAKPGSTGSTAATPAKAVQEQSAGAAATPPAADPLPATQQQEDMWEGAGGYVGNMLPGGLLPQQAHVGPAVHGAAPVVAPPRMPARVAGAPQQAAPDTTLLTLLAISLSMIIVSILIRKALVAAGYEVPAYFSSIGLR